MKVFGKLYTCLATFSIAASLLFWFHVVSAPGSFAANAPNPQQYPIVDKIADKIIQKYQSSSCQQLAEEKAQQQGQPKPLEEQRALEVLHSDPQIRQAFIGKVAAPIANKLFECGFIP